ncbi:CapA family protein [Methanobrevibacter sp.]|uniref:CapA family protein n=1 Tax=Methanobrevibacter sp. TaxID=66852 RepID=UPI00386D486C
MIRINFFGDFKIKDVTNLTFGDNLLSLLHNSEINFLNFEAPIFVKGSIPIVKSGPNFCQDRNAPRFLQEKGFNLIGLANNHALDYGEIAASETILAFNKSIVVGCGKWDDAFKINTIELKGVRIGFLALNQHEFGAFDDVFYDNNRFGTASLLHPVVDELIMESREKVDFLFVIPHAGMEYCPQPLPQIKTLYRHFIKMGASGVIGGHPHIAQPWEFIDGKIIMYSLGSFCLDPYDVGSSKIKFLNNSLAVSVIINDDRTITTDVNQVKYDSESSYVDLCNQDVDFSMYLKEICSDFVDNIKYRGIIDNHAHLMKESYINSLSEGGYFKFSIAQFTRLFFSYFYRKIPWVPNRRDVITQIMNNLQCEAHRWVILHLFKKKLG